MSNASVELTAALEAAHEASMPSPERTVRRRVALAIAICALAISALVGTIGLVLSTRGADARAGAYRRLNDTVITGLALAASAADCRASALLDAQFDQALLTAQLADAITHLGRDQRPELLTDLAKIREQAALLEADIAQQKTDLAKCKAVPIPAPHP